MATTATIIDFLLAQQRDASTSLAGGTVTFYAGGTTNPKSVWLDALKVTQAPNPYTLDARGAAVLYGDGNYKVVLKDSDAVTIATWDNVYIGSDLSALDLSAVIAAASFTNRDFVGNSRFNVWNNGTTFTINSTADTRTADGWYYTENGSAPGTTTVSRQAFTYGQTEVQGNPLYYARINKSAASTGATEETYLFHLPIEAASGVECTFRFYAKSAAPVTVTVTAKQYFGTGGSTAVVVSSPGIDLTTSWALYDYTFTVPLITGKTVGANSFFGVGISFTPNTTYDILFSQVKFEKGTVAGADEFRTIYEDDLRTSGKVTVDQDTETEFFTWAIPSATTDEKYWQSKMDAGAKTLTFAAVDDDKDNPNAGIVLTRSGASVDAIDFKIDDTTVLGLQAGVATIAGQLVVSDFAPDNLTAQTLTLTNAGAPAVVNGRFFWDQTNMTTSMYTNGCILQLGQELWVRVVNKTGSDLVNGAAVSLTGASGNRPTVALTDATNATSARCFLGLTTEAIANNDEGFVTTSGSVNDLNTNAYTEGDRLFVDPAVPGGWTSTEPTTAYKVRIGAVLIKNPTSGRVHVNPLTIPKFTDLSGTITSAELAGKVSDETGSGSLVFATSPVLVTPNIGTPSAGVVTNLTGTASININGTVGATTPAAGAFTTVSASGVTSAADGSVSAPGIAFTSDPNTGIYRIGADNLGIACNGAKVVDVGTTGLAVTGKLGVGKTAVYTLDVYSTTATTLAIFESTGATAAIGLKDSSSSYVYLVADDGSLKIQTPGSGYSDKAVISDTGLAVTGNISATGTIANTTQLVAEIIVGSGTNSGRTYYVGSGSAVTSVEFTSLDGNAAGGYVLVSEIQYASATATSCYLEFNGDTTLTNYYRQVIIGDNGSTIAVRQNNPDVVGYGTSSLSNTFAVTSIGIVGGFAKTKTDYNSNGTSSIQVALSSGTTSASITNITSISIVASVASGIAIGSTFRLYRRK